MNTIIEKIEREDMLKELLNTKGFYIEHSNNGYYGDNPSQYLHTEVKRKINMFRILDIAKKVVDTEINNGRDISIDTIKEIIKSNDTIEVQINEITNTVKFIFHNGIGAGLNKWIKSKTKPRIGDGSKLFGTIHIIMRLDVALPIMVDNQLLDIYHTGLWFAMQEIDTLGSDEDPDEIRGMIAESELNINNINQIATNDEKYKIVENLWSLGNGAYISEPSADDVNVTVITFPEGADKITKDELYIYGTIKVVLPTELFNKINV